MKSHLARLFDRENHLDQQQLLDIKISERKLNGMQKRLLHYGAFLTSLFIITIYLSTTLAIIFSGVIGLLWLFTSQFKILPTILKNSPVATSALLLYLCFFVGLIYGNTPSQEAFSLIRKYRELAFIPILSCLFTNQHYRFWAWRAFFAASLITLVGSYLMDFDILDMLRHKGFTLKSRITHSIFIAFFIFFCLHKAFDKKKQAGWYLMLLILSIYNLFFIVEGRTGQLIFLFLIPLLALQRFGKKGFLMTVLGLIILFGLYVEVSDKSVRIHQGIDNTRDYLQHQHEKRPTSMGLRYGFWERSLKLVAEKPWLGHGTGSFGKQYQRVANAKVEKVKNPHNEFLLMAVQFGMFGFIIYSGFFFSMYYCSRKLPETERWLAQGLLLTLFITSLFNSPFLDHTEGHWFAVMIALCFAPYSLISKREEQCVFT